MTAKKWQFWIDRGGTFTDIVAKSPQGQLLTHKLLSENPEQYTDAAIAGIRHFLDLSQQESIDPSLIDVVKMGTTVATNALLERKGQPCALLVSEGLKDALFIGYQTRPDIFALAVERPEQLYQQVLEVPERMGADGDVVKPLDIAKLTPQLQTLKDKGIESLAIVLMHGYRYQDHEKQVANLAKKMGFKQISVSHEVSPLQKIVSRGDTTVVDAYLSPVLGKYVSQVAAELNPLADSLLEKSKTSLKQVPLYFMQSSGGLSLASNFQGKDAILSGPAGGVVGMVKTAQQASQAEGEVFNKLVGFDMGGTSTDVSHYAGEYERQFETQVAGVRLRAPMMQIHTVAAGGGSIVKFQDGRYQVGPESAGANPGPACYRRGGPLTVTDCNVLLGKIQPQFFPAIFGEQANQMLDKELVAKEFTKLANAFNQASPEDQLTEPVSAQQVAQGFLNVAVENMANAVKRISIQRGYDLSDYTLVSFGGAGGQHACLVAEQLGVKKVMMHPFSGVLSAFGIGLADQIKLKERAIEKTLNEKLLEEISLYSQTIESELANQFINTDDQQEVEYQARLHIKYLGSDNSLLVNVASLANMKKSFEAQHQQLFGFVGSQPLLVEALQVEARVAGEMSQPEVQSHDAPAQPQSSIKLFSRDEECDALVYQRNELQAGQVVTGPCLVLEETGTIVIESGWQGSLTKQGDLLLNHFESQKKQYSAEQADPVLLEIFNNRFMNVAEQMGYVLERTAASVNIKERLDFSCAVFNDQAQLIANAPHIPVHLGSMSESVVAVIKKHGEHMTPGDVYAVNTPYNGGTHLPDVTLVKPVFVEKNNQKVLSFFVAARGHHADIGGITPGSMPPFSQHISQEGILMDGLQIVRGGEFLEEVVRDCLLDHEYPARNVGQNIADLKAQIASCEKGAQQLLSMVGQYSLPVVNAYMGFVLDNAELAVRNVIKTLADGQYRYEMDDGCAIEVLIKVNKQQGSAVVDFAGTSAMHKGNFNAPSSVAKACVLYAFRCLVSHDIPLNAGIFRALDIQIPNNSMLSPQYPAAVVSGNVETAQYVVDTLLLALGVMAGSQGTNNNFTFGNDEYQYYETLCGGIGAVEGHDGASAVHAHMTNSRLTDPEVLESRYPVRLEKFEVRKASGGAGKFNGGDGMHRQIRFLQPMTAAMISGHRQVPPAGVKGGGSGKCGVNQVVRKDGKIEGLEGLAQVEMNSGDAFDIQTPGAGGHGESVSD
jgi:5-oxoprolinase (ATP-hydrolysing)